MDDSGWNDGGFDEFGGGGDDDPADDVLQVVASAEGLTARSIATSLRFPVEEVGELLEELHANGEVEKDGDGLWVVPDMAGPDDPYIF